MEKKVDELITQEKGGERNPSAIAKEEPPRHPTRPGGGGKELLQSARLAKTSSRGKKKELLFPKKKNRKYALSRGGGEKGVGLQKREGAASSTKI